MKKSLEQYPDKRTISRRELLIKSLIGAGVIAAAAQSKFGWEIANGQVGGTVPLPTETPKPPEEDKPPTSIFKYIVKADPGVRFMDGAYGEGQFDEFESWQSGTKNLRIMGETGEYTWEEPFAQSGVGEQAIAMGEWAEKFWEMIVQNMIQDNQTGDLAWYNAQPPEKDLGAATITILDARASEGEGPMNITVQLKDGNLVLTRTNPIYRQGHTELVDPSDPVNSPWTPIVEKGVFYGYLEPLSGEIEWDAERNNSIAITSVLNDEMEVSTKKEKVKIKKAKKKDEITQENDPIINDALEYVAEDLNMITKNAEFRAFLENGQQPLVTTASTIPDGEGRIAMRIKAVKDIDPEEERTFTFSNADGTECSVTISDIRLGNEVRLVRIGTQMKVEVTEVNGHQPKVIVLQPDNEKNQLNLPFLGT